MTDAVPYRVRLALGAPCGTCGEARAVAASGTCLVCGASLPEDAVAAVRAATRRRRQTFKGRLNRLEDRLHRLIDDPLVFAVRGVPQSATDHLANVLLPTVNALGARHQKVAELLDTGTWDPEVAGCVAAFIELVGVLDAAMDSVTELRDTMPPIEWRAIHRELTRAAVEQIRGQVLMTLTIVAPDMESALQLQAEGNSAFAAGEEHAQRVTSLIDLIRHSPPDGPFQEDGSLDIATLTWSSVREQSTSIAVCAEMVRDAFAALPGVRTLPDEYAVGLLPVLAAGASVVDHHVLIERSLRLRATIDAADAVTGWVADAVLLVSRVQRGLDRVTNRVERIGREWHFGLPRLHVMDSLTEVYRQLVEGALKDLGGVLLVAARASRGEVDGSYSQQVVDGIKAGDVVSELDRMGAPFGGAVQMLYRNASAHADVEVTNEGMVAIEREIRNGRVVHEETVTLSDAEFYEEFLALQEILLALQLTLLPWLWAQTGNDLAAAVATMPLNEIGRARTLALVGDMAGLRDIRVVVDGDRVGIAASLRRDQSDRREIKVLSIVPAAFGAVPTADRVTSDVEELRPVTFGRSEFIGSGSPDAPPTLPLLGFTSAKWLLESGMSWTAQDEATYVTFPLTMVHFDCMRLAGRTPQATENIGRAVESLRIVSARLDQVLEPDRRSPLTRQAVEQIDILTKALVALAESRRGRRSAADGQRFAHQAAATCERVFAIQEEAKGLRDANPDRASTP